jgi:Tol biopolymer transport system component
MFFMYRSTFYSLFLSLLIISCKPAQEPPLHPYFYVYRFNPPALVEFSEEFQPTKEIPFSIPVNCGLLNLFPAPIGEFIAIELSCPNGQTVLFLDTNSASTTQPVTEFDSHFLAWTPDGKAIYLRIDSLGDARILRAGIDSSQDFVPITEFTYDLAPSANIGEFTFTFSRGLGQGSELWLARQDGRIVQQLHADQFNYISFARWSPDGKQIAFIKIPDTQTPFTVGELWVIPLNSAQGADSSSARKLADADAGHGYAANWSPDGKQIAFVQRENPEDEHADQSSEALLSDIYVIEVESGELNAVTAFDDARAETPFWSPDGNTLAFTIVSNGRMQVQLADLLTGEIRSLLVESACCPAWLRK